MPLGNHCPVLRSRAGAWALAALTAPGCASGPTPPPAPLPAAPAECVIGSGPGSAAGPLVVAAAGPADSALVARQRLLPPVVLDCAGRPRPGAADDWSADSSGTAWTLVFTEAAPDAGAAAMAWRDSAPSATLRFAGVRSLVPLDRRRLVVTFGRRFDAVPSVFADPALALPIDSMEPSLVLDSTAAADPRDALDRGADLLRTADPAALEYARSDSAYLVAPLPWSRSYVFLQPAPGPSGSSAIADSFGSSGSEIRGGLARDAVRVEARAAEPPYWWEDRAGCPGDTRVRQADGAVAEAILFAEADEVARALAGRIVALSDRPGLAARGLPPAELRGALLAGRAWGFVLALPRPGLVPCRETADWPADAVAFPLVDTRASAVVRRGVRPLFVEYDGTLRPRGAP